MSIIEELCRSMDATGFSIEFMPLEPAGQMPLEQVQKLFWEKISTYVWDHTSRYNTVWDYLAKISKSGDASWFTQSENAVTYWFPSFSGRRRHAAEISEHLMFLAYAALWHQLDGIAGKNGWRISGNPPSLANLVRYNQAPSGYIDFRDHLFEFQYDTYQTGRLSEDGYHLSLNELSTTEREKLADAAGDRMCACPLCTRLRLDTPLGKPDGAGNVMPNYSVLLAQLGLYLWQTFVPAALKNSIENFIDRNKRLFEN